MGKSKRKRKTLSTVSFDEEIVTKNQIEELLQSQKHKQETSKNDHEITDNVLNTDEIIENQSKINEKPNKPPKKKKIKSHDIQSKSEPPNEISKNENTLNESTDSQSTEKKESIRSLKRKKHLKLLEEKKLKTDLHLQEKALNYLSKWKHSKDQWKFEKLRQIWLQQNMFDANKVPDEFWQTLIDYFNGAKGKSKDLVLKEALKAVEKYENKDENDPEDEEKLKRAKELIQYLLE